MSVTTFKKGDVIFREGDKITSIMLIQSGGVQLCHIRGKKNIELAQLGPTHVLGEFALMGAGTYFTSAVATAETQILELPTASVKQQVEASPQPIKVLVKSILERSKVSLSEMKVYKMDKDPAPCPEDQVAKIFGTLFHTANHKGEKKDGKVSIDWTTLRQYGQRIFGEGAKRLEQALCILVKLKLAQFEMGKNPDNPSGADEIQRVHFFALQPLEDFFEFYQYYYFKGGKSELLKPDDFVEQFVKCMVQLALTAEVDRFGIVSLDYGKAVEKVKADMNLTLSADHFVRLENKGVMVSRKQNSAGQVLVQFEVKELRKMLDIWRILREIAKWNEKGMVDMNETEMSEKKKATATAACPSCQAELKAPQKFCAECGYKLAA
jgi:hypothetical protein